MSIKAVTNLQIVQNHRSKDEKRQIIREKSAPLPLTPDARKAALNIFTVTYYLQIHGDLIALVKNENLPLYRTPVTPRSCRYIQALLFP